MYGYGFFAIVNRNQKLENFARVCVLLIHALEGRRVIKRYWGAIVIKKLSHRSRA